MTPCIFGRFLELSLPVDDIRESLAFYGTLGFTELVAGDIRRYYYGIVGDGRIAVGLHAAGIDEPALSFVRADVAACRPPGADGGTAPSFARLGVDDFHEIGMHTPDGHLLIAMEAATFSRAPLADCPSPVIGRCVDIGLGCRDLDDSARYWTAAGFVAQPDAADDSVELLAPGLRLSLRTDLRPGRMALRFAPDDLDTALGALERCGTPVRHDGHVYRVTAPEGTQLELITGDTRVQALPRN